MYYTEALYYMITKPPFNAKYAIIQSNYFCKIEKEVLVKEKRQDKFTLEKS